MVANNTSSVVFLVIDTKLLICVSKIVVGYILTTQLYIALSSTSKVLRVALSRSMQARVTEIWSIVAKLYFYNFLSNGPKEIEMDSEFLKPGRFVVVYKTDQKTSSDRASTPSPTIPGPT